MDNTDLSTRVNAARLSEFIDRPVRLTCKVLKMNENRATVQASDGGQVSVQLSAVSLGNTANMDSYVEVVGRVVDATQVQMFAFINLGDDLGACGDGALPALPPGGPPNNIYKFP